jgi:hypothetical protein
MSLHSLHATSPTLGPASALGPAHCVVQCELGRQCRGNFGSCHRCLTPGVGLLVAHSALGIRGSEKALFGT